MLSTNTAELFNDLRQHPENYNTAPLTPAETAAVITMLYNSNSAVANKLHLQAVLRK